MRQYMLHAHFCVIISPKLSALRLQVGRNLFANIFDDVFALNSPIQM